MRFQNQFQQFMNHCAPPKAARSQQVTNMLLTVTHMLSSLFRPLWAEPSFTSSLMIAGKREQLGFMEWASVPSSSFPQISHHVMGKEQHKDSGALLSHV